MHEHDDQQLVVEVPTLDDAAPLAQLKADTFVETFAENNDPDTLAAHVTGTFTAQRVASELTDPRCSTLWVVDAGAPIGYLKMNFPPHNTEPALADGLEVEQIYFRRSHQGRGLGRRLIGHAIEVARAHRLPYVWLGVWEHNLAAIGFYETLGLRACGEHTFWVGDDEQRDLLMRLDLATRT